MSLLERVDQRSARVDYQLLVVFQSHAGESPDPRFPAFSVFDRVTSSDERWDGLLAPPPIPIYPQVSDIRLTWVHVLQKKVWTHKGLWGDRSIPVEVGLPRLCGKTTHLDLSEKNIGFTQTVVEKEKELTDPDDVAVMVVQLLLI